VVGEVARQQVLVLRPRCSPTLVHPTPVDPRSNVAWIAPGAVAREDTPDLHLIYT
jgi:hypothetical protein